jgi:hypothetical protein
MKTKFLLVAVVVTLFCQTAFAQSEILFPNPANVSVTIKLAEPKEIIITNMIGDIVKRETLKEGDNTVVVESLKDGMYLVQLVTVGKEEKVITKRLVVRH